LCSKTRRKTSLGCMPISWRWLIKVASALVVACGSVVGAVCSPFSPPGREVLALQGEREREAAWASPGAAPRGPGLLLRRAPPARGGARAHPCCCLNPRR
jgi:hypothetical protein